MATNFRECLDEALKHAEAHRCGYATRTYNIYNDEMEWIYGNIRVSVTPEMAEYLKNVTTQREFLGSSSDAFVWAMPFEDFFVMLEDLHARHAPDAVEHQTV